MIIDAAMIKQHRQTYGLNLSPTLAAFHITPDTLD